MKTITQSKFYQLVGLLTLANNHVAAVQAIEKAANDVLGTQEEQWIGDAVWGGVALDATGLLEKLNITVEPPTDELPA